MRREMKQKSENNSNQQIHGQHRLAEKRYVTWKYKIW